MKKIISAKNNPYEIQEFFTTNKENKKIRQELEVLDNKEIFISKLHSIQKEWAQKNEKSERAEEELNKILNECFQKEIKNKDIKDIADSKKYFELVGDLYKKYGKLKKAQIKATQENILVDENLDSEVLSLVKKSKLLPYDFWNIILKRIITKGLEYPSDILKINPATKKSVAQAGIIKTENCRVFVQRNRATGEDEIFIKIFGNTSLDDIKKSWGAVKILKDTLNLKFNKKEFYPIKNLKKFKELKEWDSKKPEDDYDPDTNSWKPGKMPDSQKAIELYSEGVEKDLKRAANRVKQLRFQSKKRFKE